MPDPCRVATSYAERIAKTSDIETLAHIGAEIKVDIKNIAGWESWLRDWWLSRYDTLSAPKLVPEEVLNKAGLKALAKGEITLE